MILFLGNSLQNILLAFWLDKPFECCLDACCAIWISPKLGCAVLCSFAMLPPEQVISHFVHIQGIHWKLVLKTLGQNCIIIYWLVNTMKQKWKIFGILFLLAECLFLCLCVWVCGYVCVLVLFYHSSSICFLESVLVWPNYDQSIMVSHAKMTTK